VHEDPRSKKGDRTGPKLAETGPVFLALEGSSTLKPPTRRQHREEELFAPEGHPQARERGGRSPAGDQPPRRKHPLVEKEEDTGGRETMINGAMISTLMG
jgi:hypothetical protein